ncbi:hypothetical protein PAP_07455 [Palaeococcus pacificus DY20341]|uniref:DUF11 domain-containing protein n=1 Tax=Palaeococcus pacificus DY20341 TaxID=1343739 RepID=A0A075LUR1_9EURY|nr:hypothetical protein [Palaeococcus pacificus]AIF69881.1 hypothetical protein PAP_07455 [Palaeococcus pacificus DY20341]
MRKILILVLSYLILSLSFITAQNTTITVNALENENQPYEEFWNILNKEAELIIKLNQTADQNTARELITNSQKGAENAVQISALIWQNLKELEQSGVKTYYTTQELRSIAEEIKQNGLPAETVSTLKEQGWSDSEIQALQNYIVQNADQITEDFNMTAFLEEFSTAFINVAFKYNEYETWAIEKWKWTNAGEAPQENHGIAINPILAEEWALFYMRYSQKDYKNMSVGIKSLKDLTYKIITGSSGEQVTSMLYRTESILSKQGTLESIRWIKNGGLVITFKSTQITPTEIITERTTYYWPNALKAYELMGNVYALIKTRNYGNNNPKVESMLNQKVAELKEALKVLIISSEIKRSPIKSPIPIKPGDPRIPAPIPVSPKGYSVDGTQTFEENLGVEVNGVLIEPEIIREALDTQGNIGQLKITEVKVIVDKNQPGKVEYHVKISFKAENNAVDTIRINVKDYTTGDSDTGTLSFLNSGQSYAWNSKRFTLTHSMDGELTVSGKVEITYTPSCGAVPLSKNHETLSTSPSCQERTITREYSSTINLESPIDWSKVSIRMETSRDRIVEGESVTYRVVVENGNSAPLSDVEYSISIPFSPTNSKTYSDTVNVPANGAVTLLEQTITYEDASTYVAHASIYWNGNSKSASKSVTVTSGTLTITGVDVSPANPTHGDSVSFDVSVKNPVSRSRSVMVKLFIDDAEKASKTITIGSGGSGVVSLTWTAVAGTHKYRIEVWEGGKLEASRSGGITVGGAPSDSFNVVLTAYPTELEGSGTVYFTIKAWNYGNTAIPLSGFVEDEDGAVVKRIDGFAGRLPANAQNYTLTAFSLDVYGIGNHTFKLFLDNYDGKPNGAGEEHWSEVKVEVKPWKADLKLECDDGVVLGENDVDDLDCTLYLLRTNPDDSVQVKISGIDVGGAKVWPSDFKEVTLSKDTLKVTPNDPDDETHIKITIDENFAEFYFGIDPLFPWHSYVDKLATEQPWEIVIHFENAPPISTTFQILKNSGTTIEDAVEYGGSGTFVVTEILEKAGYITTEATGSGQLAVFGSRLFGYAGLLLFLADITEEAYFYGWKQPRDFDNDGFVG